MIGIKAIECVVPDETAFVKNLPEYNELSEEDQFFFENCGIDSIRIDTPKDNVSLSIKAATKLLEKEDLQPNNIDVIIYLQPRAPDYLASSTATRFQSELGASKAISFTLTDLGCVNSSMALILAKQLLANNCGYKNILLAYVSNPVSNRRFRSPVSIIGDGGVAVLVAESSHNIILDHELQVEGKYWDLFRVDYKRAVFTEWAEDCSDTYKYSFNLALESKNRFTEINNNILQRNKLTYADIQQFIMQNISFGAFRFYQDLFNIKFCPVCRDNLRDYGHLGPMDILFNLSSAQKGSLFEPGDKVLLMNNSPVAAWSSILLQI